MNTSWLRQPKYTPIHFASFVVVTLIGILAIPSSYIVWLTRIAVRDALRNPAMAKVTVQETGDADLSKAYAKPYNFTVDMFGWRMPVWRTVMSPYAGRPNVNYLEVGLFEGMSFVWMAENVLTDPTSRMTGIDIFDGELRDRFFANLKLSGAEDKATIINQSSQVSLRILPLESFDLIYIDGSHVKCDVLEDAVLSWRLLKVGGLMIFDDYDIAEKTDVPGEYRNPKVAIDAFYSCFDRRCEVVHNAFQVILRKTQ